MVKFSRLFTSKVIANSAWIIVGKIVQMIISFFVGIWTARYLGPSNYGVINTAVAYSSFFLPLCTLGLSGIFVKELLDHPKEEGLYLGSGIGIRCIASVISMICMLIVVFILNPTNQTLFLVCVIHSFVLPLQSFDLFEYWYQSRYQSKYSSSIGVIGYFVAAIYRVILLVLGKNVEWFAFATVIDYAVIAICYMTYSRCKNNIKLKFSFKCAFSMLDISKHLILANLMVMAYTYLDKIMIGLFMTDTDVGVYSVAVSICSMWTFVLNALINSLRPNIIETRVLSKKRYREKLIQLYSIVIWICIVVSVFLCIGAKVVINVLYGTQYYASISALRIVTWYIGFSYLGVARNIWMVCEGKQKYEKIYAFVGFVSNFVLNFIMIPLLGINGAALASLFTQVITNIIIPFILVDTRENVIFILKAFNPRYLVKLIQKYVR